MKAFLRAALAALIALAPLTEAAAAAYRPLVNVAGVTKQIPNAATVQTPAPTTANASLNLPHGTAPSAPVNGDVWTTTAGVFSRINGVTIGPFGAGGGTPGGSSGELQYNNAGAFGGFTAAGDCTFSVPNFTCTKTGGVSFGYFATGTDGANLTGTISVNRFNGGSGASTSTFLRGDGTWVAPTAGVTTTGSPASGNLAKFSGASTITNGDLSGDCTTVGTLAITCLKTNGVAFSGLATASTTNGVTLGNLAQVAANTMLGNWTGSAANIVANAMPGCADSGGNHLNYVAGTGVTCGTSVGAATPAVTPNTQTGTTYTVLSTDNGKFLRFTNSGTIAVTVPQATGSFTTGFTFFACSYSGSSGGGGGVTFTPTTSTVNGLANYKLFYGGCSQWVSDGTNWLVMPMVAFYGGTGGGYSLSYQDTTASGGNARGLMAVDLQLDRNAATRVASGQAAFIAGSQNTAAGGTAVAIGQTNSASGSVSVAIGTTNTSSNSASVAIGDSNTASAANATAIGRSDVASAANATSLGGANNTANGVKSYAFGDSANTNSNTLQFAFSAGNTNGNGPVQWTENVLWVVTSGATAVRLTADGAAAGAANVAAIPSASVLVYEVKCVLHDETNQRANTYSWATSLITRSGNAATTALSAGNPAMVAGPTTATAVTALAAGPTITADTTNGGFNISFTPAVGNTARLLMMCKISGLETDN